MDTRRKTVDDYHLSGDRKRVFRDLLLTFKSDEESDLFANFIQKMPWNYAKDVSIDLIAVHWKFLRARDWSKPLGFDTAYTIHSEIADSWIGSADLLCVQAAFRQVVGTDHSPLVRAYVHEDGELAILIVYDKAVMNTKKGIPGISEPPSWVGQIKRTNINHRQQNSSISFDAIVMESATMFRIEVLNSSQTIVLRKIYEILQRHQIQLASIELWSNFSANGSRRVKEHHSVEVVIREALEDDIVQSLRDDVYRYLVALLKVHSLFDIIGPAMIGPSSSHTAGANRIGQLARNILVALQEARHFKKIHKIYVNLLGSFRDTGPGHGTHIAIGAGLKGLNQDSPKLKEEGQTEKLEQDGIAWPDGSNVAFGGFLKTSPEDDKKYIKQQIDCANVAEVVAIVDDNATVTIAGFSTGGSIVEIRFINGIRLNPSISGKNDLWLSCPSNGNKISLKTTKDKNAACIHKIYPQRPPRTDFEPIFNTFDEALEVAHESNKSLLQMALELESSLQGTEETQILANMHALWEIMKASVHEGLISETRSTMNLSGGDSKRLMKYIQDKEYVSLHSLASIYALASAETNAQMGRIVACPTAGSCGLIPGVMLAWRDISVSRGKVPEEVDNKIVEALLVAAFIGMIFYDDIPTAGATLGCQAEIGIGAAMAAAAVVTLNNGEPEAVVHAAILALKNCMGLVCDPVAGLVEVPCIKRNAMFANFAITAADMACAGIRSQIPPDQVVLAVKEVGERMSPDYRESARGGLAATLNGKDVARRFSEMCQGIFCASCQHC